MYNKGSCKTLTGVDTSRLELTCHSLMTLQVEFEPYILSYELSNPYRPIHDSPLSIFLKHSQRYRFPLFITLRTFELSSYSRILWSSILNFLYILYRKIQ